MLLNPILCLTHTHPVDLEVPQAPDLDSARGTNLEQAGTFFFPHVPESELKRLHTLLPSGHCGDIPQCSLMTMGAKAILPSTQCFLIESMTPAGKWMWRSHRKTMLCGSWDQLYRLGKKTG